MVTNKKASNRPSLTDLQVAKIRELYAQGITVPSLAQRFSVSTTLIYTVIRGATPYQERKL